MLKFATVEEIVGNKLKVKFYGETKKSNKAYEKMDSYSSPNIGDVVSLMKTSGTYFILGKKS
ncbi:hypothetical protein [Inediibacterium massiliense]|uniref:hypothetical protein n=1 Tax=Inediibacterium massiliense TaxID=1658111 RepID=UPI0006B49E9A|nr:hypothetical protein [Inediibacterium massiliense]